MAKRREHKLTENVNMLVLRLVQLRDSKGKQNLKIHSVAYKGRELTKCKPLMEVSDLTTLSKTDISTLLRSVGYPETRSVQEHCDIEIDGLRYGLRCMTHTDRAIVNHSTRKKFLMVCEHLGMDIAPLDCMIASYWRRRLIGVFNEDCNFGTLFNPFIDHDKYLRPLLSCMGFHKFNYNKPVNSEKFIKSSIDRILDFVEPTDETTWSVFDESNYYDAIRQHLCFSVRDRKGMPVDEDLALPKNEAIMPWVHKMSGRYKGALHIRVKKYDARQNAAGRRFEEEFAEAIIATKHNKGERDELLLKLFLIECRENHRALPIGERFETVLSVGSKNEEYKRPLYTMEWNTLDAGELVFICAQVGASKAGRYAKADVYVNHIGISVKSENGAPPSIINHTTRDKILRVMNSLNIPIAPLDAMVNCYWNLRLDGKINEDVKTTQSLFPFAKADGNIPYVIHQLLTYFSFDGTGMKDSEEPAELILSLSDPRDPGTWTYYNRETFIPAVWSLLKFSLRSKSVPDNYNPDDEIFAEIKPWIRLTTNHRSGESRYSGALSVRVEKS